MAGIIYKIFQGEVKVQKQQVIRGASDEFERLTFDRDRRKITLTIYHSAYARNASLDARWYSPRRGADEYITVPLPHAGSAASAAIHG
jgi:hypothetical protein